MKLNFKGRKEKGITLIALVITIIVLLILAGVTIATLTGDNGILNQAGKAKDKTTETESIERVQVEVAGSYGLDGTIDKDQLNKNLGNIAGLKIGDNNFGGENIVKELPATVTLNGYEIVISGDGNVTKKPTVAEAKTNGTVFVNDKTTIKDAYGNSVTIPKGFKIASDSATDVTEGIVIEDATYASTIGSQFVWIPVGTGEDAIKKSDGNLVDIALGRYVFDRSGNIDTTLSKTNPSDKLVTSSYSSCYFTEELKNATTTNVSAKDIETFINSANFNQGYYIGRYEARRSSGGNLTEVGTDKVYLDVVQSEAAAKARSMYGDEVPFTSDLVNSYAWDTAIVFEQAFDNRTTNKTEPYSKQESLVEDLVWAGTNNVAEATKQDKICNIWDMSSNCREWTTEHSSRLIGKNLYTPCVFRGGGKDYGSATCTRSDNTTQYRAFQMSFRPILYF